MSWKQVLIYASVAVAVFVVGFKAYSAWNARVTPEKIAAGKLLFEHEWTIDDPLCDQGDGLGPAFNATSCVACHSQGGIGGSSGNERNVVSFEIAESDSDSVSKIQPAVLGATSGVIHANAIDESMLETRDFVRSKIPVPQPERSGPCGSLVTPADPLVFHELNSPALWGVGLIDEMSTIAIGLHGSKRLAARMSQEFSGDFSGNKLGMLRTEQGVAGKFGWKGQFASLGDFVASACAMEIGLTNSMHSQVVPKKFQADQSAKYDMTNRQLNELVCFVKTLPRPQQILPTDRDKLEKVMRGQEVFNELGCADCHVEDLAGIEGIYSDFHLYNLEEVKPGAGDGFYASGEAEEEFRFDDSNPHPDQWQTPPLWGVADSAPYFHDGRSPTLKMAIERHRGQAEFSSQQFKKLTAHDQHCLIRFLKTLRAPQLSKDADQVASVN